MMKSGLGFKLMAAALVLDVIAFGLAVAAEVQRSTATVATDPEEVFNFCVYSSGISTIFGVAAFFTVLASQVLLMVCSQCGKALKADGRTSVILLFCMCWVLFTVAQLCLLVGSTNNAYRTSIQTDFEDFELSCRTARKGVFGAGAGFIFLNSIASKVFFVAFSKAKEPGGGEVAMATLEEEKLICEHFYECQID